MFKNRFILISSSIAIVLNIVLWIVLFSKFGMARAAIPLHFNVISGIDLVGSTRQVYQLPALGLVAAAINFFLSRLLWDQARLWSQFFSAAGAAVQVLLAVSVLLLLSLNT